MVEFLLTFSTGWFFAELVGAILYIVEYPEISNLYSPAASAIYPPNCNSHRTSVGGWECDLVKYLPNVCQGPGFAHSNTLARMHGMFQGEGQAKSHPNENYYTL